MLEYLCNSLLINCYLFCLAWNGNVFNKRNHLVVSRMSFIYVARKQNQGVTRYYYYFKDKYKQMSIF